MGGISGRLIVGTFEETRPVKRKDDSVVAGMWEIHVSDGRREWPHKAVFFESSDGEESAMSRQLKALEPQKGDRVFVRITSKASTPKELGKASYVNDTAVGIYGADESGA